MPSFIFSKKRRPSDAAVKTTQPVNVSVDVEPIPRMPSKFRSLVTSGLFTRSANDLRRSAGMQSRSSLVQNGNGNGGQRPRSRAATTSIKIASSDVPSLPPQVADLARDKAESVRGTSGESSSLDGHSEHSARASPQQPPKSLEREQPPATPATTTPSPARDLTIETRRDVVVDAPLPSADESLASPMSTAFVTPPQRLSEEQAAPVRFPTAESEEILATSRRSSLPTGERPQSTLSNASTGGTPASPRKMSLVLHSAPMPLPIAHLPHLSTPSSPTAHAAPWGDLARNGGPKSPVCARTAGPSSSTSTFPWTAAPAATQPAPATEGGEDLTDADLHRVTRAMPVMLRVPSRQSEPADDGGDAGDDDSITDSEEAAISPAYPDPQLSTPSPKGKAVPRRLQELGESSSTAQSSTGSLGLFDVQEPARRAVPSISSPALRALQQTSRADTPSSELGLDDSDNEDNGSEPETAGTSFTLATPTNSLRPPLFSHASRSMINLSSPISTSSRPLLEPVAEAQTTRIPSHEASSPMSPARKRRLSDGDINPPPPKYEPVIAGYHHPEGPSPKPREEEGRERLPPYWCGVHIEGTLSRKMEFVQPGLQAKDRAWKKYYFVLHGTALFVYKFDPSKVPLRANEPYLECDPKEVATFLHVHPAPDRRFTPVVPAATTPPRPPPTRSEKQARRNTISLEGALRSSPIGAIRHRSGTVGSQTPTNRDDGPDSKNPDLFSPKAARRQSMIPASVASSTASAPLASHMPFAHNMLVHKYTLQGAESGLAADYKKRLHCVRIRAEGQQFMLQTETARQCVQWIEAFQAATNVALDLDVRPMPIQQTLPRRRRRPGARRTAAPPANTNANANGQPTSDQPNAAFEDTPEGNIAAVEAAERAAREAAARDRDRMLAEDQAANVGGFHG